MHDERERAKRNKNGNEIYNKNIKKYCMFAHVDLESVYNGIKWNEAQTNKHKQQLKYGVKS